MESKEIRIAELEKQILEIKNGQSYNYELVEVSPDCGGGIQDSTRTIAISKNIEDLISYCEQTFSYTPMLSDSRPETDINKPCETWFKLSHTRILIIDHK